MEFPFGHQHTHHHHHQRDDEEDNREKPSYPPPAFQAPPSGPPPPYFQGPQFGAPPPPPPSYFQETEFAPPPPTHVYHTSDRPEQFDSFNYHPPAPAPASVPAPATHVAHEVNQGSVDPTESHHSYRPHLPSFPHHKSHSGSGSELSKKPTVKVCCKAEPNFSLTIRDGKVILAASNPDDEFQHWYKDEKFSTRVKDEEGFPCFALVNKATGQALKHSVGATHPVQLIPYNADVLDESILWTESKDIGAGYRTVRMVNNIRLNVDAFHGDKKSGGVHDGTSIVLWEWNKGDNQLWKIVLYCKFLENQSAKQQNSY